MPRHIRGFALTLAAGLALACPGSALAQDSDPTGPFGPLAGYSFDPLALTEPETVAAVDQPYWWRMPVFNAYFGSGLLPAGNGIESVALGQTDAGLPRLYVATARTNRVYVFNGDSTSLAPLGSFGDSGAGALSDPAGLAFWHGQVYVLDRMRQNPQQARVVVYDDAGNYQRQFPLINPAGMADMTGLDLASGEAWVTGEVCGGLAGVVEIFDAATGAVKGITGQVAHAPTGDPSAPCDEGADSSAWWDLATIPELNSAIAQYRLLKRGLVAAFTTADPELTCYSCFRRAWQDGIDAVWGMRWLLAIDGASRTSRGTSVTEYSFEPDGTTGDPYLQERRHWYPQQAASGGVRDVAYLNRDVRIDWSGKLTEDKWLNGLHSLHYVVSDADIYAVGARGEAWYELARHFDHVDLAVDGQVKASSVQPVGDLTFDTNTIASGTHQLTLTAYLTDGSHVVATNRTLRVDHDVPTGTLDALPVATNTTVDASGTIADVHSGPLSWQLQVNGPASGGWQPACTATAPDGSGKWGCPWKTQSYPEGTYQVRALLTDSVRPGYGQANTSYATALGNATVIVDRTPPNPGVGAGLHDRADLRPIFEDERPPLTVDATDALSGVTSVQIAIEGTQVDSGQQGCPGGGCGMTRGYTFEPQNHPTGDHGVAVRVTDQAGNVADVNWNVYVLRNPPDHPDESSTDALDQPGAPGKQEPAAADIPNDGSPVGGWGGGGTGLTCDSDDPYRVTDHLDYAEVTGGLPGGLAISDGAPTPAQGAAAYLLAAANLPAIPSAMFDPVITTDDHVIYVAQMNGQPQAWLAVVKTPTGGWRGTWFEACGKFVSRFGLHPRSGVTR